MHLFVCVCVCVMCVCVCVCVCVFLVYFRYFIDIRWLKQWKKYVGYDPWDQLAYGLASANPGPVHNSALFRGTCMCLSTGNWFDVVIWKDSTGD